MRAPAPDGTSSTIVPYLFGSDSSYKIIDSLGRPEISEVRKA